MGKDGLDLLRELVNRPGVYRFARRDAIEALGRLGDPAVDGPVIHRHLADKQMDVQSRAAQALASLRYRPALPDLERIARDPKVNQNVRYGAIFGVLEMTDKEAGDRFALELTDRKHGQAVQSFAYTKIGERKAMAGLPVLLEAVESDEWITRLVADRALRGLARKPEGVGFDPQKPDPKKWREFWEKKGK